MIQQIQFNYNVILIRNNGRVIIDEDFTYRLELVLADTYKTFAFSYFKEKLDIKEYRDNLYTDAVKILKARYGNKLMEIDFIYIAYQMTDMLNESLHSISSQKLSEITA